MSGMFWRQFMAIQAKNWTINKRAKQFLRQNLAVLILSIFIIVSQQTGSNGLFTPFYLSITVAGFSRTVAVWWLEEKESHQKELQKIMGISQLPYILSWLSYFFLNGLLVSLVMITIMRLFVVTEYTKFASGHGFIDLACVYFLYTVSNIGYVMLLCTFFSKAKTGSQAVTFIQLVSTFLYFLGFSDEVASNQVAVFFFSILPQMSFNMALSKIAFGGLPFDFSYQRGVVTLALMIPIYTLIAMYLDLVVPNELGTHKHPLFFLGVGYKQHKENAEGLMRHQSELEAGNESSAKYEERIARSTAPLITMKNVSKCFGQHKVLDDLSVSFFGGEVFCLLGHNGAGKSTTINILTGLLQPTSGSIEILGYRYPADMDEIRLNIGLCLQYNVLYDNLTVEQHLLYYYRIKHADSSQSGVHVNQTIVECALDSERGKLAKNLSGGNKRKLCLANSLIGGSKIVFLDEPSSGLDPNSRQAIWDILKTISRQSRCIILTTHHLEEAQELSKRIAIMSKGKLTILGSADYIADKFSVGYQAVITLDKGQSKAAEICRTIISSRLQFCTEDKQTAKDTLKFRLPLSQVAKFAQTFRELEQAKIGMVSVYMSNLEDAFVKIGEQEDEFSQGFEQLQHPQLLQNSNSFLDVQQQEKELALGRKEKNSAKEVTLPRVKSHYSFTSQFKAVFTKKMKTVLRSFSSVVSVIMPTVFVCVGVLVVCIAIKNDYKDPRDRFYFNVLRLLILNIFMTWAFIFNTSSYCGSIVLEREKRFKYITNVSGTRQLPYWTANYAFDLLLFYVPLLAFFVVAYAIGSEGEFITQSTGYFMLILLLFGLSFIGYSYLFSFVFQKSNTAFRFFPFINLVFFYFLPLIPSIVDPAGILAQYIMPALSPFVALNSSFNSVQILGFDVKSDYKYNRLYVAVLALSIQAIVYALTVLKLETSRFSLKATGDKRFQQQVAREQEAANRQSFVNAPIKISRLTKIYGNGKLAIRDNSFSVGEGEIFGLLGPNGAGKSTSFNIVTAAIPKTYGTVKLFGEEINRGIMDIFEQVGVCPQYNPIYQNLTLREHLRYFALIKGVDSSMVDSTIEFYKELLSLEAYMDVKAGVLSGGNKRKMCVAMAMIGNPKVAFFDQPSAGVDPISRRYLWKSLTAAASTDKASMILTTHSMNQAESLCSRIGILIKGQFVCLDTPKKLKEQYGKGYRINVLAQVEHHEEIEREVAALFREAVIEKVEIDPERILFVIKAEYFSLWRSFELFENKLSAQKKLKRYEIKESTLEEVFIHLSRLQPYVEEEQFKEPWQILCWEWGNNGCQLAT